MPRHAAVEFMSAAMLPYILLMLQVYKMILRRCAGDVDYMPMLLPRRYYAALHALCLLPRHGTYAIIAAIFTPCHVTPCLLMPLPYASLLMPRYFDADYACR